MPAEHADDVHAILTSRSPSSDAKGRFPSIVDYHEAYRSDTLTPLDVVNHLIPLISRDVEKPTPYSTAFLQTIVEEVHAAAERSTARWKAGNPLGLLDGIPFCVKDELDIEGYRKCLGSSRVLPNGGTSWCVQTLMDEGAIMIGKSNMHELGTGMLRYSGIKLERWDN